MTLSTQQSELVVVTGASTGIGAATARTLAQRGFHVLAGVRRDVDADAVRGDGVEPLIVDITSAEHVAALAARVAADPHGRSLRAVVNNAGVQANVPIEVYAIEDWRRMFEVNLFGHVAVTQALLPALCANKGRVVNIGSVGGRVAMAGYGPYAATKFALEAVTDSLRRELAPTGVRVVIVEPGGVRTEMPQRALTNARTSLAGMTPEQCRRYGALIHAVDAQTAAHTDSGLTADTAAAVVAKAVTARSPRTRYTVGRDAAVITKLVRVLPDRALDHVLTALLRPHYPSEVG